MRIVGEIPHPECKITLFSWNNRFLIKIEQGMLEQTFKINQFDIAENDLPKVLDDAFVSACLARFDDMSRHLYNALDRL